MTPDIVSEYATLNGMVKACQRFIMALAGCYFRCDNSCAIGVCYFCVFLFITHLRVETSNSALFLNGERSGLSGVAMKFVGPEAAVTKCYDK